MAAVVAISGCRAVCYYQWLDPLLRMWGIYSILLAHLEMLSLLAVAFCKNIKFWIEDVTLKTARLRNICLDEGPIEHCSTYVIAWSNLQKSSSLFGKTLEVGANSFYIKICIIISYGLFCFNNIFLLNCIFELVPSQYFRGRPWLIGPLPSSSPGNQLKGKCHS